MSHWTFVTAAYLVVVLGSAGVAIQSWLAMRKAESAADALRNDR